MKEGNNEIVSAAEAISVDYEEILQRAVAVIENARASVARHLAATASNTYRFDNFPCDDNEVKEDEK